MILYPLIVAAVTLVFAVMLYGQYRARGKPHHLYWFLSMAQGCVASVAYILAVQGAGALFFKLYYLFGALMVAAYLGLGSVHLVAPGPVARFCTRLVLAFTVLGAAGILAAPVDGEALRALAATVDSGKGVLGAKGLWLAQLIVMNLFGTLAVVLPALHSALQLARKQAAGGTVLGNVLIALGVFFIAGGGTAARLGAGGFWKSMAVGYVIAFLGFLAINRAAGEGRAAGA